MISHFITDAISKFPYSQVKTIKIVALIVSISCIGCKTTLKQQSEISKDNPLIEKMYAEDLRIRELDTKSDTINLEQYDKVHRDKIFALLANNQVKTPLDKYRSALILQHTAAKLCEGEITSISPENFLLAYHLSSSALNDLENNNNTPSIKKENVLRIIALNYDRYLLFSFGYQKFGTQFVFDEQTNEMLLAPIDTTLSNDEERVKYKVEPLNELLRKHKMKTMPKGN